MAENISRLGYLMRMLDISGKELSKALSIDKTTISKWRNNQRKLTYKSKYTRRIARYCIESEAQCNRGRIASLLAGRIPGLNTKSENQLVDALCVWLTEEGPELMGNAQAGTVNGLSPEHGYNTGVRIYIGYRGIVEALTRFWEYTLTLPPGQEILFADYRDIDFEDEGRENVGRMIKLFIDAARYGHTIKIIDCATDVFRPYIAIFRWLPMYLSENVEVWRHQDFMKREVRTSTCVLPNEIVLNSHAVESLPDAHHSMIFHDRQTVGFMEDGVRAILRNSKKMIETIPSSDVLSMLEILDANLKSMQLTYMINPVPTFRNMPAELLGEILRQNDVGERTISICLEANRKTRAIRDRCRYVQIYDLDAMEERVRAKSIVDYDLSAICGKRITVSKESFRKHLAYLLRIRNSQNYSMVLTSFSALNLLAPGVSIIAQDDSLVVAWDAQKYLRRMYCKELVVVNGFYSYMEDLWKAVPPICKSGEWKDKQLERMNRLIEENGK